MNKKNVIIGLILIVVGALGIFLTTNKKENYGLAFKNDYESVNGKANASGKIHRVVDIPSDNPFITTTSEDIVKRIENKETFYVYFGSKLCPWCRSSIEKACEVAALRGINKIYYVDIWDNEGSEIVRDKYKLDENNKPILEKEGDANYSKLLEAFKDLLSDYTLTDAKGNKVTVGEKRIYAPNYIYVEKGVAKKLVTGTSEKQKDSREELTKEMLADEEKAFNDFFAQVCDDAC